MLSRSLRASRICAQCRLTIDPRSRCRAIVHNNASLERATRRSYSSNDSIADEFEAIIARARKIDGVPSKHKPSQGKEPVQLGSEQEADTNDLHKGTNINASSETNAIDEVQGESNGETIRIEASIEDESAFTPRHTNRQKEGFKHDLLHQHDLGVNALGKRVEALVIKNPNRMKAARKSAPLVSEESVMPAANLRWQDMMPKTSDAEEDSSAEVMANIEELRPVDTDVIPETDFKSTMAVLQDGFTSSQLVWYMSKNQEAMQRVDDEPSYPCILRQTRWESASKDSLDRLKPKAQLALSIMRSIWKLYKHDEVEGLGRVKVWLPSNTLRLLAQCGRSVLVSIRDDFLDPLSGEKISIALDDDRLTIYSRRSAIMPALARIETFAEDVAFRDITLEGVKEDQLRPEVLQELGKLTDTIIQYDPTTKNMTVSWIATSDNPIPDKENPTVTPEDPGEIVWRLLIEKSNRAEASTMQIINSATKGTQNALVQHLRETKSMSWRDKLRQWSRYVHPRGKRSASQPLDLASRISIPKQPLEVSKTGASTVLSANFGHVLHLTNTAKEAEMATGRRILSPVTPHPAALTNITNETDDTSIIQHTAIVLNFSPTVYFDADEATPIPNVRLRLPIHPETDFTNFMFPQDSTLYAVTTSYNEDILLPGESVDVRLTQEHVFPMDLKQKTLRNFIALCRFALLEGYLKTPHMASFTLPAHCVGETHRPTSGRDLEDISYLFMGLEIHQTTKVQYKGHTLKYNSVEAGQHGGQRQELSLLPGPPSTANDAFTDGTSTDMESFLKVVEEIVKGDVLPWNDGASLMQSRSQERFTDDLLDESYDMEYDDRTARYSKESEYKQ